LDGIWHYYWINGQSLGHLVRKRASDGQEGDTLTGEVIQLAHVTKAEISVKVGINSATTRVLKFRGPMMPRSS